MAEKKDVREKEQPGSESAEPTDAAEAAVEDPAPESATGSDAEEAAVEPEQGSEGAATRFDELQAEFDALNERHLRLAAEFDNYRKRTEREGIKKWARAQAELAGDLLEALDDLERVTGHEPDATSVHTLLEGARLADKKLREALESAGLEPIDAEGEPFDPAAMEALMTVPAEEPEQDEVVADVFQRGYRFNDLLIRPARVRVKKYEE